MTNLETYLGLRLYIMKDVDPNYINNDEELLNSLRNVVGFNPEEFFIYVHTIVFYKRKARRREKISDLIEDLELSFKINKKQQSSGLIRFYNDIIINQDQKVDGITEICESTSHYIRIFESSYLDSNDIIKSKLITYVSKELIRKDHRKIKISIKFTPNTTDNNPQQTEIDLKLDTQVVLNFRGLSPVELDEVHKKIMTYRRESEDFNPPPTPSIQPTLFKLNEEGIYNDLRHLGVIESEIKLLKEIILRHSKQNGNETKKKIGDLAAKIAKRSLDRAIELDMKSISDRFNKLIKL